MHSRSRSRASDNQFWTLEGNCRCPRSSLELGSKDASSPCLVLAASRASNDSNRLSNWSLETWGSAGGVPGASRPLAGGAWHTTPRAVQLVQGNWRLQRSLRSLQSWQEITRVRRRGFDTEWRGMIPEVGRVVEGRGMRSRREVTELNLIGDLPGPDLTDSAE